MSESFVHNLMCINNIYWNFHHSKKYSAKSTISKLPWIQPLKRELLIEEKYCCLLQNFFRTHSLSNLIKTSQKFSHLQIFNPLSVTEYSSKLKHSSEFNWTSRYENHSSQTSSFMFHLHNSLVYQNHRCYYRC